MSFRVGADAYDRFMGRYSEPLAAVFVDFAAFDGGRVLDVGCGPGALTSELVRRVGPSGLAAVDPSPPFVEAMLERHPDVDVRSAAAESLPFAADAFDAALAQLVVHFMSDPVAGLSEMRRVVRPGGVVAACVWDFAEGGAPLYDFWSVARSLDPDVPGEERRAGARSGELRSLLVQAGLHDVVEARIAVSVTHASFDEWWEPYTLGVGPAGEYVASLSESAVAALRDACRAALPAAPFTIGAAAWAARGRV